MITQPNFTKIHRHIYPIVLFLIAILMAWSSFAQAADTPANTPTPQKAKPESVQAWRDARFGMFIHWGPVSLTELEISWSRANSNPKCPNRRPTPVDVYDNLYKKFDPVKFDAKAWVATAQAAGMKYMVLTVKHCDGFLLWDSKVDAYNIMHTPFKRDVAAELAQAAHEAGMKLGWYYSPMDWRDPDCRNAKNAEFVKRIQAELTELLTNYGKIDLLWFDTDGRRAMWDQANTYAMLRRLQPEIVINNRLDAVTPGLPRWDVPEGIGPWADYYTPEQFVGGFNIQQPWESCMTVSAHNHWAWGGHKDGVKSFEQCISMLIQSAGGDGNMILNVGPMPDGAIAPEQAGRIKEMGDWLAKYGQSIYGTRGGPFKPGKYGVCTRRGKTIYLHIQKWPGDTLMLPAIAAKILHSQALTGGNVTVQQTDDAIEISLPTGDHDKLDTIIALELDRPASDIEPLTVPSAVSHSLATGKKATASNIHQNNAGYGADRAFDDDDDTRWATDGGIKSAWLEVDLGKPLTIGRAIIHQAYPELKRVRKFAIEYMDGNEWKACYQGENLGATLDITFPPITAQHVRLNITESTDGPTISEFQLFKP